MSGDDDALSREATLEILASYRDFVNQTLEPQLKELVSQKEALQNDINAYSELIDMDFSNVSVFNSLINKKESSQIKWTHIGSGVHVQSKSTPEINNGEIYMDVGLGFRLPVTLTDVPVVCRRAIDVIAKKAAVCQAKIDVVVADIEQTLLVVKELEGTIKR